MADRIDIPSNDVAAPEGHDAKMAALGAAAVDGVAPEVPASEPTAPVVPDVPDVPATDESKTDAAESDAADEALKGTGLELATYEAEFAEKGELSEASYAALEKAGIPKAIVDQYIEGQKAVAATHEAEAYALVGGESNYQAMVTWASTTLTAEDKAAFNAAIGQGGAAAKLAISGLNAQFKATQGSAPKLLGGFAPSGGADVAGFRSTHELTQAMADPRYSRDPAYRKDVEAKLAASNLF